MKIDEIRALLEKYQLGTCTAEEQRTIEEWYTSLQMGEEQPLSEEALDSSLARIQDNLRRVSGGPSLSGTGGELEPGSSLIDARQMMTSDARQMMAPDRGGILDSGKNLDRRRTWRWIAACAAAVVLVVASLWLLYFARQSTPAELALNNGPDGDTTVITSRGETRQIVLSDGSTIYLNAGTAFTYPKQFTHRARSVELLQGEAFFQVVTNPAKPFTVTVGKSHTTVLGTSFNIRAYRRDNDIQISLLTGKVNVSEDGETHAAVLSPHQFVRINPESWQSTTGYFERDDEVAAWREGAMHFHDASFEDIAFEIGNKFNVQLRNSSGKSRWSYNGLFRSGSLQEAIETICQTENLAYSFTDSGIVFTDKN